MSTGRENKKEIAVVAVTKQGAALARSLGGLLPADLYLPEKFAAGEGEHGYNRPVAEVVKLLFRSYRYLVLVMAAGIAVRLVAPELHDKHTDPGVVTLDEGGKFCISLLSGHVGGANELAGRVAALTGAQPVVTTASEVSGGVPVDILGREFGWTIEDDTRVKAVSAALVNGAPAGLYQDAGERGWLPEPLPDNLTVYDSLEELAKAAPEAALVISDRTLDMRQLPEDTVVYRPRTLVVGLGCNRNTAAAEIEAAVQRLFYEYGLAVASLRNVATIDIKKDEAGILAFAAGRDLPVAYFGKDALAAVAFPSAPSDAALRHTGTPSVCEAAALLSSNAAELAVPKASYKRKVTIAVARAGGMKRHGRLYLVGIGPGDLEQMTLRARQAIAESDVVVGYKEYLKQIEPLLGGKEVAVSGMGAEVARVKDAFRLARQGRKVALVSGGDTGIYGMAGLVGELLHKQAGEKPAIEVVPGVPALVAGAALLGSPLSGDFAAVSLSDYLVPWDEIARRLRLAAQGNFVIAVYNPRSKKRPEKLAEARDIILQYRHPSTPVGLVTGAYRPGQQVVITDLGHLLDYDINMNTVVIIGNATTFTLEGWMATPRGYGKKYELGKEGA